MMTTEDRKEESTFIVTKLLQLSRLITHTDGNGAKGVIVQDMECTPTLCGMDNELGSLVLR